MAKSVSSATNVRAISFAENRTLRSFVLLYGLLILFILLLGGTMYYRYKEAVMLSEHRLAMQLQGEQYLPRLVRWMQGESDAFPVDPAYLSAFYLGGDPVDGNLDITPADLVPGMHTQGGAIYLVIPMGSYGLKDGATIMKTDDDGLWRRDFWEKASLFGILLFLLLFGAGYRLSRLFLRPMNDAVSLLDRFIKDTTHELNTPVTTIRTNIERFDLQALDERNQKKLQRITMAARTIETLYDDLTYLLLENNVSVRDEVLDLDVLLRERLEYFRLQYEMKRMQVSYASREAVRVRMDRRRAERLIDNLLSNAIKYGNPEGRISVQLRGHTFTVFNTGIPIPQEKLRQIFNRYVRAESSKGGFGIGLHIVRRIVDAYGIGIEVVSDANGTLFTLNFGTVAVD